MSTLITDVLTIIAALAVITGIYLTAGLAYERTILGELVDRALRGDDQTPASMLSDRRRDA